MPRTPTRVAARGAARSVANDLARRQPDEIVARSPVDVPQPESRMNRIARRAHELYEARGGKNHGNALEDWLQAEREIDDAIGATEP
jgi:Protein of unknown function (DUF2934)